MDSDRYLWNQSEEPMESYRHISFSWNFTTDSVVSLTIANAVAIAIFVTAALLQVLISDLFVVIDTIEPIVAECSRAPGLASGISTVGVTRG